MNAQQHNRADAMKLCDVLTRRTRAAHREL
jgi:hypothetical protein